MMTRKHYIAIAAIIRVELDDATLHASTGTRDAVLEAISRVADELALLFAGDNPNFDGGRFQKACFGS